MEGGPGVEGDGRLRFAGKGLGVGWNDPPGADGRRRGEPGERWEGEGVVGMLRS